MSKGHTTIVIGAYMGDEGKSKIATHIALKYNYDIAVRAGTGTNAGHSLYYNGRFIHTHQLPLAGVFAQWMGKDITIAVGSGVCFDYDQYIKEYTEYNLDFDDTIIDYRCPVILPEHKEREQSNSNYGEGRIGSTKTGTGEARADYVRRITNRLLDYNYSKVHLADVAKIVNQGYDEGKKIIIEGSQAHYLSLYLSPYYPVVTSDNCTAMAFADDAGLAWNRIDDVCMVVKSAPTMVAQNVGILPSEISREEMEKRNIVERGVTTGRIRRKSLDIPFDLLNDAVMINQPTYFALTFCDHVDDFKDVKLPEIVMCEDLIRFPKTYANILELEKRFQIPVRFIEYGKELDCISEVM